MQKLQDILEKDLKTIFEEYADFTRETKLKVGADEVTVFASLQSSGMEFSASEKPVNAYKLELFVRTKDIPKSMSKRISRDAIIYIDETAYKVIDSSDCRGVLGLSLERGSARGNGLSGREL